MNYRIFIFLWGAAAIAAQPSFTLDDAIRTAWAHDPVVSALALTPELARAREVQAGTRPNPELEFRSGAPLQGASEWALGIGVSQRLPRRDRVELARAYARLGGEAAGHELRERRRQLAGEVRRLWYDLAVQEARLKAAQRAQDLHDQLLAGLERRRTLGEVADAAWDLSQLESDRAGHAVQVAVANHAGALARLRQRLRWPAGTDLAITTDLAANLARPLPTSSALDQSTRPELALTDLAVRQAEAALAVTRSETKADWTVGAGVDFARRANDASGRLENEPQLSLSASVPWPREAANRGHVLEKEAALRIATANREALREEMHAALLAVLATAQAAQEPVQRYQSLLTAASALPKRLEAAFARGEVSSNELAQARQQRVMIEADFLAAAASYLTALAEAETAVGLVPAQP